MNIYRGKGMRRIQRSTGTKDLSEAKIIEQGFMRVNRGETSRERMVRMSGYSRRRRRSGTNGMRRA